jgi:hypothetical protein
MLEKSARIYDIFCAQKILKLRAEKSKTAAVFFMLFPYKEWTFLTVIYFRT